MRRIVTPELIDRPSADPVLLRRSLGDLAWMNRYLGVTAGIAQELERLLDGASLSRLSVLDVAAGGGDIVRALDRWCGGRGLEFEGVALDLGRATARVAAARPAGREQRRIGVVCADARALPFADRSFDIAICSTFLHHLELEAAAAALHEMARVSAIGVVVTDLRRGPLGYLAAWTLANTLWRRHPYTRHDAVASMRAAYTLEEARDLAGRAGLAAVVEPQPWFRWALRWRRTE